MEMIRTHSLKLAALRLGPFVQHACIHRPAPPSRAVRTYDEIILGWQFDQQSGCEPLPMVSTGAGTWSLVVQGS